MAVYDELCQVNYDENRDEEYPAFIAYNNDNMAERALNKNALPVIYSIKPNATINHEIAMDLRSCFQSKKLRLLINELEGREFLIDKLGLLKKSAEEQANLLKPYMQTTALVNETVNLEYRIQGGLVKVEEVGSKRKDRYTSLGYVNYLAKILEKEIIARRKKKKKAVCCFW